MPGSSLTTMSNDPSHSLHFLFDRLPFLGSLDQYLDYGQQPERRGKSISTSDSFLMPNIHFENEMVHIVLLVIFIYPSNFLLIN